MQHNPQIPECLLRLERLIALTGLCRARVYELMQHEDPEIRLPLPIKIGRTSHWPASEIHDWIERQKARRAAV